MRPFFDSKKAVEYWRKNGGWLELIKSPGIKSSEIWWWSSTPGKFFNTDETRTAIIAAGYTEHEADEMMEGGK